MIKSSIEKLSESIGYDIGMSDDLTQANLLNGLFNAFKNSMNEQQFQMQICYLVDKLNSKSVSCILEMAEFIKLKEQK
jgi:hypothetical protein